MKSKIFAIWMCALLVLSSAFVMLGNDVEAATIPESPMFSGAGSGTPGDPYVITNVTQLQEMENDVDAHYILGNDIDASSTIGWNAGAGFDPVGEPGAGVWFTGSLDGCNYTISDLYINRPGTSYVGLFGYFNTGSVVKNVGVINMNITGHTSVGGLVGANIRGLVHNSYTSGVIYVAPIDTFIFEIGGLVGNNLEGTVSGSHSSATLNGYRGTGGLVGYNNDGLIESSYATGNVYGKDSIGGLVGISWKGSIVKSFATGTVTGTHTDVGGLIGYINAASVDDCYATGNAISATSLDGQFIGGLIGEIASGWVNNSYATGTVTGGANLGGVAGTNGGTVINCFWDTTTSGMGTGIGSGTTTGATGVATVGMKTEATFTGAGWDFTTTWIIDETVTYPLIMSTLFAGGDGTAASAYIITDVWELQNMNLDLAANYTLGNDINALVTEEWNAGAGFEPVGSTATPFTGTLDGQGYVISNLYIDRPTTDEVALFGFTDIGSLISEVELENVDITGQDSVGSMIGNCYGNVTMCYMESGTVTGGDGVGGLIAYVNPAGAVNFSYSAGFVVGTNRVGGLIGHLASTCNYSASEATVIGDTRVGGLVGIAGDIGNCYATGNVTAITNAGGGLAGEIWVAMVNSYSTGAVSGGGTNGGLAGTNPIASGSATNCYWDTETSGMPGSTAGTGRTTAQMMQQATFVTWDFSNVWDIKETFTYPFFMWEQFNSAPIAQDDLRTTNEEAMISFNVTLDLGNGPDVDPDGDPIEVYALNGDHGVLGGPPVYLGSGASVQLYDTGMCYYNPNSGFQYLGTGDWAIDTFDYTIYDNNGTFDNATVYVNVTGINDRPVISDAAGTLGYTEGDGAVVIDNSLTVSDIDDTNLEEAWVNITANYQNAKDWLDFVDIGGITKDVAGSNGDELHIVGTATVAQYEAALETVTYENTASNPTLTDRTITWWVSDGEVFSTAVTSTVTMSPVNTPPIADAGGPYTINEGQQVILDGSGSSDPEGVGLTYAWDLDNDGVYDDATGVNPTVTWATLLGLGLASDGSALTIGLDVNDTELSGIDTTTLTIDNLSPDADSGGPYTINEGQQLILDASGSSDPGSDSMTYAWDLDDDGVYDDATGVNPTVSWATLEGLGLDTDGTVLNIGLEVTDTESATDTDASTLTINNQAPTADAGGPYNINEGQQVILDGSGSSDPGSDALTYAWDLDNDGVYDDATGVNPTVTWATLLGLGLASDGSALTIGLEVTDTESLTNTGATTLTINNLAPTADADGPHVIDEGQGVILFGGLSTDPGSDALSYAWDLDDDGSYDDATGFNLSLTWSTLRALGLASNGTALNINLQVTDSDGASGTDTTTLTITNLAPTANAGGPYVVDEGQSLILNGGGSSDPGNDALTYAWDLDNDGAYDDATGASPTINWTTILSYGIPINGTAVTIGLEVTDTEGLTDTDTSTVSINNVAPVAANDAATVNEDSTATTINVLDNDVDIGALTIIAATQGTHGTVVIINSGTSLTYLPDADFFGTDTFTYTITDGELNDTATVTITVDNVNDDPIAEDDTASVDEDSSTTISVLENDDFAPDVGETLTIDSVTQGAHGTVTISSTGTKIVYKPEADFFGNDTFTYTMSDGNGGTATATVTMTVNNVNDAPTISGSGALTAIDGDVYTADFDAADIDGDTITWTVTGADWLSINSAGIINGSAETGTYTIRITASDGNGGSDIVTYKLTVEKLDTDNDGVPDDMDEFPTDANETVDHDDDGIGDNADTDDDNDGVPDATDDFPYDSSETTDTDNDGIGDNTDTDDDGDGVADVDDPEPLDGSVSGNEYVSGWPYWYVLGVIGVAALIGLAALLVVWFITKE